VAVALLAVIAVALITSTEGTPLVGARQQVPTPRGQLGGPEPLPTGSAQPADEPVNTPEPAECERDPVPLEKLLAAAAATPAATPDIWAGAVAATEEQTDAARLVIVELIACANANDPARTLALYSPDGLVRALARQGFTPQTVELALNQSGEPLPESAQARMISLDRVVAADEDHLRVELTLLERAGIGEFRMQPYVIDLVRIGETWLIDDIRTA
jgi:hypothetical protein